MARKISFEDNSCAPNLSNLEQLYHIMLIPSDLCFGRHVLKHGKSSFQNSNLDLRNNSKILFYVFFFLSYCSFLTNRVSAIHCYNHVKVTLYSICCLWQLLNWCMDLLPKRLELEMIKSFSNFFLLFFSGNDPVDEDVDIGGNDPPLSSYPPVEIEKDTALRNSKRSSSSSSSSDSGSSSSGSCYYEPSITSFLS